jgi:uncharacterized protein
MNEIEAAKARRTSFVESMPAALIELEEALPKILTKTPGSKKSKLKRIYVAIDQISKIREPFVACSKGCADCCKMNISISRLEAQAISDATGKTFVNLSNSISHEDPKFIGVPCPFLNEDSCSIYEHRPLACRTHSSFHTSAEWCKPDALLLERSVPMLGWSGIETAFIETSIDKNQFVIADIRDFFTATA